MTFWAADCSESPVIPSAVDGMATKIKGHVDIYIYIYVDNVAGAGLLE